MHHWGGCDLQQNRIGFYMTGRHVSPLPLSDMLILYEPGATHTRKSRGALHKAAYKPMAHLSAYSHRAGATCNKISSTCDPEHDWLSSLKKSASPPRILPRHVRETAGWSNPFYQYRLPGDDVRLHRHFPVLLTNQTMYQQDLLDRQNSCSTLLSPRTS